MLQSIIRNTTLFLTGMAFMALLLVSWPVLAHWGALLHTFLFG